MQGKSALDPNVGELICLKDGVGIHDPTSEHVLYISPSGGGKTTCGVIGTIFHTAKLGYSQLITDCKPEIAYIVKDALEKEIGCRVALNNPSQLPGLPHHDCNPLQLLIDDYATPEGRKNMLHDAENIALQLRPEPEEKGKDNEWVRIGMRDILVSVSCGLAAITPQGCTLAKMRRIIARQDELLRFLKALATRDDILSGDLADKALDLLSSYENTDEHFEYYRKGALNALSPYAASGQLGHIGASHDYAYEDLRDDSQPPLIVINVCPLEHLEVFKSYFGLMNYTCFQTLKRSPQGRKVAMVLDEFTNFKVDLASNLTALRALNVRCFLYAQSESEIARAYGEKMLATIKDQCRVKVYFGIKDPAVAKTLSDMIGPETINAESYNFANKMLGLGKGNQTIGKAGRPLLYPSEIIALDRSQMIAFIDNKIVLGEKITYAEVWPWCDWAAPNPLEGGKLTGRIKLRLKYPRQRVRSLLSWAARLLPRNPEPKQLPSPQHSIKLLPPPDGTRGTATDG